MSRNKSLMGLDVGTARIGVALADDGVRIAIPYETVLVDGTEVDQLAEIIVRDTVDIVVVGYPRNQSGEPTHQTKLVEEFADRLSDIAPKIVFQDESLTSVIAENRLKERGAAYSKADIDSEAATIILQDYLEANYGR